MYRRDMGLAVAALAAVAVLGPGAAFSEDGAATAAPDLTDLPRRERAEIVYAARRMLQFDDDNDGKLSQSELPRRMAGVVARGDQNGDGYLDENELTAMSYAIWKKRKAEDEAADKAHDDGAGASAKEKDA